MRTFVLLIPLLIGLCPRDAFAQAGRGVRPEVANGAVVAMLVAKDVDGQRWSIRLGLEGDTLGFASGIVTDPMAGTIDPAFVQCQAIDATGPPNDVDHDAIIFDCQVGPKCPSRTPGSCQAWQEIGDVTIPASFFLPPP